MQSFLKELFEYNHHYNQELAQLLIPQEAQVDEKALKLFNHILNAHHIWNCRIAGITPRLGIWEISPLAGLADTDQNSYEHTLRLLNSQDLETVLPYKTSRGEPFKNKVRDILFHVINHSTYHRGQIASILRAGGIDPLTTDYIFYKR